MYNKHRLIEFDIFKLLKKVKIILIFYFSRNGNFKYTQIKKNINLFNITIFSF